MSLQPVKRYWQGDNGAKRKPIKLWASMRSGFPGDGQSIIFRWGDEKGNVNQKVVINEQMAEMLAKTWIKANFEEVPQVSE